MRNISYYKKSFTDASILFPLGAFNCIRNLQFLSGNNLVLLSSDKGATDLEFVEGHQEHTYALHDSVFSYMVNYHAISQYFEDQGGCSFFTTDKTHHIITTMNILLSQTAIGLTNSRYTFEEKVKKQNLINYLYDCEYLLSSRSRNSAKTMLRSCMAFLRLSNFDPTVLTLCGTKIYAALNEINEHEKEALVEILANVRSNVYMIDREYNAFHWLGKIYYGLKLYDECLDAFHQSVKLFGPDDDSLYYIAACHELKSDYEVALDYYMRKLIFDPSCPLTQDGIERVKARLQGNTSLR